MASGQSSWRTWSRGWRSMATACMKVACMDMDMREVTFSQPLGRPTLEEGKGMTLSLVGGWMEIKGTLAGVVSTVVVTPWKEKRLAMSTMGFMCPGAMNGKKRM